MFCVELVIVGSQRVKDPGLLFSSDFADMMASESLENKASSRSNASFFTKSKVHRQFEAVFLFTVLHSKNDALSNFQ